MYGREAFKLDIYREAGKELFDFVEETLLDGVRMSVRIMNVMDKEKPETIWIFSREESTF